MIEKMTNWKNLRQNPPSKDCNICVKVGSSYETYCFKRHTDYSWELLKYPRTIELEKIPGEALYINLDEIE